MTVKQEIKDFYERHPWPDKEGIKSLYRFYKFDIKHIERLEQLFINGKLYHPTPEQFNDPFECAPHFRWPTDRNKVKSIRKHLVKTAMQRGITRKKAESDISNIMTNPQLPDIILNSIQNNYKKFRICSFTVNKRNLLLWSHYADSHKGFCVEFDATIQPIFFAQKVNYENKLPEVSYPMHGDGTGFGPALIKSEDWEYENEYRIIYHPDSETHMKKDGSSLCLNDNVIKNVYFGANMDNNNKIILIDIINKGIFQPNIWNTYLSKTSFELEFLPYVI